MTEEEERKHIPVSTNLCPFRTPDHCEGTGNPRGRERRESVGERQRGSPEEGLTLSKVRTNQILLTVLAPGSSVPVPGTFY